MARPARRHGRPTKKGKPIDWNLRRVYASAIVCETIAGGDHLYAPARRHPIGLDRKRFSIFLGAYRDKITGDSPAGIRCLVHDYADELAARIDATGSATRDATTLEPALRLASAPVICTARRGRQVPPNEPSGC